MFIFSGALKSHTAPLKRARNRKASRNPYTQPLQLIQDGFDVVTKTVCYKSMPFPPLEELSKLIPERAKPLRANCQNTAVGLP
jgi:hypothetical protein